MPHSADPVTLIAALVVLYGIAAVVWFLIAAGLRESPWICASLGAGNALLCGAFLLQDALGLTPPAHQAWSELHTLPIGWLWGSLLLGLLANGWIAFLLLLKLVLEIRRLTERDPLTDALNRRALAQVVDAEHSRQRRGQRYALVLLDMDRFKHLNDTLGHAAGDAALKALVSVVRPCLREVDRLARLGGEEFCVLLPHTGIAGAALAAERMRALLAGHAFSWEGQSWPLTASFGIAESSIEDDSAADVMRRADQALYRAKAQGRNVVQAVELEQMR